MLFVAYRISLDKKAKGMVFPKIFSYKQVYHAFRFYANRLLWKLRKKRYKNNSKEIYLKVKMTRFDWSTTGLVIESTP